MALTFPSLGIGNKFLISVDLVLNLFLTLGKNGEGELSPV
jgi:hypothetical protein